MMRQRDFKFCGKDTIENQPFATASLKTGAGLKAGMLWAGMMTAVFFVMLRAVFSALSLMMKEPKPRR